MPKKSKQASPTFELKKYEVLRDQPVRKTSKAHADQKGTVKKGMIVICEVGRPLVLHWGAAVLRLEILPPSVPPLPGGHRQEAQSTT